MSRPVPFLLHPASKDYLWGGTRLNDDFSKHIPSDVIAETWECSTHPDGVSIAASGEWIGMPLDGILRAHPEYLGEHAHGGSDLPVLVKFIDAKRDLSIQVHPNDEMAQREHGKMGKSEMWYIIKAEKGAHLYAGFKQSITPYEYQKRIEDGSITEVLADHQVKAGDVFYLPAGRVHAICGGIMLAEVQQSSDVTYRIYDYNRPGLDGKPRELHTELAAQALDYHVEKNYLTEYTEAKDQAIQIVDTPYFDVRIMELTRPFHRNLLKYDSFIISMCIEGDCKLRIRSTGDEITLREGTSTLIPASIADYDVIPLQGNTCILDAFIDNLDRSLSAHLARFFIRQRVG